jgi:hypothetical protein
MMNAIHESQNLLGSRRVNVLTSLARTGGFTVTGRELFLTHSAITHSIQALESDLVCGLLNRLGKKWINSRFRVCLRLIVGAVKSSGSLNEIHE